MLKKPVFHFWSSVVLGFLADKFAQNLHMRVKVILYKDFFFKFVFQAETWKGEFWLLQRLL